MKLRVRVIYTERMLLCGDIVAQGEIQLIETVFPAGDRGDRVVRCALCLCEDESFFICVRTPFLQDMVSKLDDALCILTAQTDDGQRPFYNAGLYILISCYRKFLDDRSFSHGECIISALEMIVA